MITLEAIGVMIAAVTLCGAIFKFAVIRQLETAIDNLSDLVKELRESLKTNDNRVRSLQEKDLRVEIVFSDIKKIFVQGLIELSKIFRRDMRFVESSQRIFLTFRTKKIS